ncbi:carbonic anhydrase 2-like protein [Aphelenchoides avenae]|nr:carbonic anhydrase 2-like protein [Aphelenchus avenae]
MEPIVFLNYDEERKLNASFEADGARVYGFNVSASRPAISGAGLEEAHELVEIRLFGDWRDDVGAHSFNGRRFGLEVLLIHRAPRGTMAVLSVGGGYRPYGEPCVFEGCTRRSLNGMIEALKKANENSVETSFELKPSSLLPENRHPYYAYNGTIMGDCGTEARYFVLEDRLKLPQERMREFRSAISVSPATEPQQFSGARVYRPPLV